MHLFLIVDNCWILLGIGKKILSYEPRGIICTQDSLLPGSLSDAVGRVTMDDKHEEHRQRLRNKQTASGAEHIAAGIRGLGLGLYGGLTSIVSQTYTGVTQEGIPVSSLFLS